LTSTRRRREVRCSASKAATADGTGGVCSLLSEMAAFSSLLVDHVLVGAHAAGLAGTALAADSRSRDADIVASSLTPAEWRAVWTLGGALGNTAIGVGSANLVEGCATEVSVVIADPLDSLQPHLPVVFVAPLASPNMSTRATTGGMAVAERYAQDEKRVDAGEALRIDAEEVRLLGDDEALLRRDALAGLLAMQS